MTKKPKKDYLNTSNHPHERREYIDYDYTKKLSPEERAWLEKFTGEYYGADFKIRPTYVKEGRKYIQISGDGVKPENKRDLRKCRKLDLYYKDENGKFTMDKKYKYSGDNVHENVHITACNTQANSIARDVFNKHYKHEVGDDMTDLVMEYAQNEGLGPEEIALRMEDEEERRRLLEIIERRKTDR